MQGNFRFYISFFKLGRDISSNYPLVSPSSNLLITNIDCCTVRQRQRQLAGTWAGGQHTLKRELPRFIGANMF